MVQAQAFLKSRLRADSPTDRDELAQRDKEMEAGRKV